MINPHTGAKTYAAVRRMAQTMVDTAPGCSDRLACSQWSQAEAAKLEVPQPGVRSGELLALMLNHYWIIFSGICVHQFCPVWCSTIITVACMRISVTLKWIYQTQNCCVNVTHGGCYCVFRYNWSERRLACRFFSLVCMVITEKVKPSLTADSWPWKQ